MRSDICTLAEFTSPSMNDATALPVSDAPRLLVMSGEKVRLPEEPRSRVSSFTPVLNSPPNLYACVPRDHDTDSRICRSVTGVWTRATVGLLSDAVPKFVVAADAVADCEGPYPGILNTGNA